MGWALEIILSTRDFDAEQTEAYGMINRALDTNEIGGVVDELAQRIAQFPSASIEAYKSVVYASVDLPITDALK